MADNIPVVDQPTAPQPSPEFVIAALQEENAAAHQNRLYLVALLKQLQSEYQSAQVQWEAEKQSLLATIAAHEAPRND